MRKGMLGLLLAPLLLALLLWLTLPWTAAYLLTRWLEQHGFEQPQLELRHPSWQHLQIDRFSARQTGVGRQLTLTAEQLELRFSPLALLRGQLRELRIHQLRLDITADASLRGRLDQLEQRQQLDLAPFDPARLFQLAPSQRLVIARLDLHYQAPEQPLWRAQGNLDLAPELLQARLQLLRAQQPIGYLDLNLDPALNLALSLSRDGTYLLRSAHRLEVAPGHWQLRSDLRLDSAALAHWLPALAADLSLPLESLSGPLQLHTRLTLPDPLPTDPAVLLDQLQAQGQAHLDLTGAAGPDLAAAALSLPVEAALTDGQLQLQLGTPARLQLQGLNGPSAQLEALQLQLEQPLRLQGPWRQPSAWQLSPLALRLTPTGLTTAAPLAIEWQPLRLRLAPGPLLRPRYPLQLDLPGVRLQPPGQPAIELAAQAALTLDSARRQLEADGELRALQGQLHLHLQGQLQADGQGRVHFTLPTTPAPALYRALRPWLPPALDPLAVSAGQLSARGRLELEASGWTLQARPQLRDLDLIWDQHTRVHDVDLSQQLEWHASGRLSSQGQLEIAHSDVGLRLFGPRLDFTLAVPPAGAPRLSLSAFSLSALDGIIAVPPLSFNPLQPQIDTRIAVSALALERLLALYPQQGLYGQGLLGGALPLRLDGHQLSIRQGQLISQGEGGVIRYRPTADVALMGQQNPGIQLALDALTDFRFDLLDLTLDYAPDGEAVMRARLKGRNPDWQQGRPVDLNLTIEENLLDLLRTLRLSDRVTDAIDRRVRR